MRPIGVDLFAGAGGLSLGFEQAGFDVLAAVEVDPVHAATHKFNFPECTVIPSSVKALSGKEIREKSNIGERQIGVVFGGAPCQGFSLIGHRALNDPRNTLVKEFVRLVAELRPNYFVFENVKGLTVGRHRAFLEEVVDAFSALDYRIRLPWRVLNAGDYGIPQDRERVILIGALAGTALPTYPPPKTRPAGSGLGLLSEGPSAADALGDLPNADDYEELLETDATIPEKWGYPTLYARELRCLWNDAWHFGYPREWNPARLTSSMRTMHTAISRRRFADTRHGETEPISRFYKLDPDRPSNTLRAGTDSARGAFTSPRPIHYEHARCVTVREMARLHGFPDWFRFHATKWHGARQIGNAVPPPLARAIAATIFSAAGIEPIRPELTVTLGDERLLHLGMSEAADYWNVAVPIGRRDRKSGARKRSQSEIEASRIYA